MKIIDGALVREQNPGDVDDSAFDTSELRHELIAIMKKTGLNVEYAKLVQQINLDQFIIDSKLQRHPKTHFMNDISSDQAHMYALATKNYECSIQQGSGWWPRTSNGNLISFGFWAFIGESEFGFRLFQNLSLIFQIILFWIPVRWCDGENPDFRLGFIKLNLGYKHHAGDYRLFKQCLYYAPWILRRMVAKSTLKKMTRIYWAPEPNVDWLIAIDDKFVDECL